MSISNTSKQIPNFIRKVHTSRYQPRIQHDPYKPLAAIYVLRLALGLKKRMSLPTLGELFENDLGDLTGLIDVQVPGVNYPDPDTFLDDMFTGFAPKVNKGDLFKHMRGRLKQLMIEGMRVNTPLIENLNWLADQFNLSAIEQEILAVRMLMNLYPCFKKFINEHCYQCSDTSLQDYLSILTARPIANIEKCLAPHSALRKMGWLEVMSQTADLEDKLNIPPALLDILLLQHESAEELLDQFFTLSKPSILQLSDYVQLQNDLNIILPYLQAALETQQKGINLLIHGNAAHGKIELAKLMAQHLGIALFEVRRSSNKEITLGAHDRFAACKLSQHWLSRQSKPGLVLVDNAEDIFPSRRSSQLFRIEEEDNIGLVDKAWLDLQMENNPIPMIWIVNKAQNIDTRYLRRFDYSLEIDKAPLKLRGYQIDQATRELNLSAEWCKKLAKRTDFSLRQITKAAAVAKLSQAKSKTSTEAIMERALNASHRLLKQTDGLGTTLSKIGYDLTFTNTNIKLPELLTGLRHMPRGNFCFYGAPGTGKTAFANHIADQLEQPLLIKRASDILSKYIGESERNIARMFDQARRQDAILLLDEADSLLGDRRNARQNWEVSQVNEMLTQMERFNSIFICTTNLMDRLDAASLRRFDFKVKFDYLNAEQRWALFQQESLRLGAELPKDGEMRHRLIQKIHRLTKLTPGDFAVLNRQVTLLGRPLALDDMIAILEQECLAKGETFSRMGFVH